MNRHQRIGSTGVLRSVAVAFAVSAAFILAACGGDDSSSGGGEASADAVAGYEKRLDDLYKGTYTEPVGGPVKVDSGKNIWVISAGQNIETSQRASAAIKDAGEKLDWDVTVFDGKFNPTLQLGGVEQALADGADGIIGLYVDCSTIKNGLKQASDQNVPTIAVEGANCPSGGYTHSVLYAGGLDYLTWVKGWAAAQAAWVIAQTDGQAKTILNTQTDLATTRAQTEGIKEEFAKCPTCEIVDDAEFVGTDFGPPLQEKIEQALIQNPDANSFIPAYDAALTSGGANALKASSLGDEFKVMGGEGSTVGIEMIYDGTVGACSGLDTGQEGYGAVDSLARIFAGLDPSKANTGLGWQVCDLDNNIPPDGEPYSPPIDYVAAYEGLWGVK